MQDSKLNWIGGGETIVAPALAVFGVWVTRRRAAGLKTYGKGVGKDLQVWVQFNGMYTVAVAVAAASFVLYSEGFSDIGFDGSLVQYLRLFGGMFGAAYTAGNIPAAIAGRSSRETAIAGHGHSPDVDHPQGGQPAQ